MHHPIKIAQFSKLEVQKPKHKGVKYLALVLIRCDDKISVLYGRCLHLGALMANGYIKVKNIILGLHKWDFRFDAGVSDYNNEAILYKFKSEIIDDNIVLDEKEIDAYLMPNL